ncbi:hypothetical protein OPV22_002578 [Ensete ventricosum]|uniref:Uncharacterized protein n=1 Tax=Ensete ventricosum TaxID=4639 RepID=A0AAV8RYD3_ENSVE|nr:hypothetical protein OPV22_002578 [Ensete ventricosum]
MPLFRDFYEDLSYGSKNDTLSILQNHVLMDVETILSRGQGFCNYKRYLVAEQSPNAGKDTYLLNRVMLRTRCIDLE